MRTPRIYHPGPLHSGGSTQLDAAASKHVTRVLRLDSGAWLTLFNGDGYEYPAQITATHGGRVEVDTGQPQACSTESPLTVVLLQGICRSQRMDLVVQKTTELGVDTILPVLCERSVVRIRDERARRRQKHWQSIAISASEQSGRTRVPTISAPQPLAASLHALKPDGCRLLLDPEADIDTGNTVSDATEIALLCGPEGGLTGAERELAVTAGFQPVRLGPRILRTETAPIVALSILQYLRGDLSNI